MSSIITITFSPCIDKTTSVHSLFPEKKMQCTAPKLEPGGGGINVARAINKLGGKATAVYPSGGYTGHYFDRLLEDEAVPSIIIPIKQETRENIIVLEETTNLQYRFGMPGSELKETEWRRMLQAVEEIPSFEYLVASGSLPPGVPVDIFARLAVIARKRNARFIIDTSGEALKEVMKEEVYLAKPSLRELGSLVNNPHLPADEIPDAVRPFIETGHCTAMVISMGAAGAMLVTKDICRTFTAPAVRIKSTVGAGDSMVGGIVVALSKGESLEEAARYGVACGTAATMNPGTELCRLEDAEKLYPLINNWQEHIHMY